MPLSDNDRARDRSRYSHSMAELIARRLIKLLFIAYWVVLTVLLTAPHPEKAVGLKAIPWFPFGDIGMHFCACFGLAVLLCLTRWPAPVSRRWILVLLAYAATTETLQAFIPCRSCELKDYCDNFLGIAAGVGIYWLATHLWRRWPRGNPEGTPLCEAQLTSNGEPSVGAPTELFVRGPRREQCVKK